MHIQTTGHDNPPLLLVHGFGCDSSDWQPLVDRLASSQTMVTCDLPAHGATPGEADDCSIEAYGDRVAELLHDLDMPPAVLVGHSMGCRVVLQTYLRAQDRVAGIVLLDGSRTGEGDRVAAERGMVRQLDELGYEEFIRAFFEAMFVDGSDPQLKADIIDRALKLPAVTGAALLTRLVGWDAATLEHALDSVRVPLMALQTTTLSTQRVRVPLPEAETSPWLELIRDHVPTARIEVMLGNGHFPHIEAPDDVSMLITDFGSGLQ